MQGRESVASQACPSDGRAGRDELHRRGFRSEGSLGDKKHVEHRQPEPATTQPGAALRRLRLANWGGFRLVPHGWGGRGLGVFRVTTCTSIGRRGHGTTLLKIGRPLWARGLADRCQSCIMSLYISLFFLLFDFHGEMCMDVRERWPHSENGLGDGPACPPPPAMRKLVSTKRKAAHARTSFWAIFLVSTT